MLQTLAGLIVVLLFSALLVAFYRMGRNHGEEAGLARGYDKGMYAMNLWWCNLDRSVVAQIEEIERAKR